MGGPAFIDRENFPAYLQKEYVDKAVIYGDMSRLVVALLANTDPSELTALYQRFGWGGAPNARAMHEAAKAWMRMHRPEGLDRADR